jgi:hypothetical protein
MKCYRSHFKKFVFQTLWVYTTFLSYRALSLGYLCRMYTFPYMTHQENQLRYCRNGETGVIPNTTRELKTYTYADTLRQLPSMTTVLTMQYMQDKSKMTVAAIMIPKSVYVCNHIQYIKFHQGSSIFK